MLHPEKRPKSWGTPPKKKGKGRDRSKGNDRDRSRSKSVERRGEKSKDKRPPSPYPPRAKADRVTEESEDEEKRDERDLERALEKVEKLNEKIQKRKGSGNAKRVRSDLFQENRREGEFMELQREWTRGDNSRGPRERETAGE